MSIQPLLRLLLFPALLLAQSVSEHPPVLQVTSTEGFLPETAEIGTTVRISPDAKSESLQILVNDEDLKPGMPPATYQYILTGLGATIFAVDQRGFVYLNVPNIDADPPNPSTYQLNVQAREVDTMPIRSSEPVTITIHIMDANDNPPVFEHPIYTANTTAAGGERPIVMARTLHLFYESLQVVATDADSGDYGTIKYRITQVTNDASDKFYYDEATNMLFATGDLIPGQRYQVVIEARDGGDLSSQAIVIILATDPAAGAPASLSPQLPGMETFVPHPMWATTTPSSISSEQEETIQTFVTEVAENTPANTVVVTLGGEEVNHQVYYNIVGGNEEGKFNINPETGAVITTDEFDRERTAMYSLQVETRSRSPDQHLYWTLIQDINDNSPHFVGPQPLRMSKNIDDLTELAPNMVIGRVEVEDPDEGDNGRLELRVAPPLNRLFSVSTDGVVSVNGAFTAAHFGEHRLFIVARDHGDPPREARAEVMINVFGTLITMATAPPTNEIFEYTTSEEEANTETWGQPTATPAPTSHETNSFSSYPSPAPETPTEPQTTVGRETDYYSTETSEEVTESSTTTQTTTSTSTTTSTTTTTMAPTTRLPVTTTTQAPPPRLAPIFSPSTMSVHVAENRAEIEVARVHAAYPDGLNGPISFILASGDSSLFSVSSFSGSITLLRPVDAETDRALQLEVTTTQAKEMATDEGLPHSVTITIHVDDENDWIPAFENANEAFAVPEDTAPGTIVGQVHAFDQDRDEPNNKIRYRLVSAGGLEGHFAVNGENGIITLSRPLGEFAGEKITLKIEASDSGVPPQSSQTSVLVDVIARTSAALIPEGGVFSSRPSAGELQFSLRNYTASVSESVRPPHLVQVLSVNNKPTDTRFIICNIVSGNYRGAFGVVAGPDGNCELRTQMELDRESVERYLLNVSVTAGEQSDFALVSVTVLDVNDNVPRFIFDNDLGLSTYFGSVASNAEAFTRVLTVKAEDADLGNSSLVRYSLDQLAVHEKYFSIGPGGEINTRQSMSQLQQKNRINFFELRVSACDSPISGQQLCTKADVVVNVVSDAHRFKMQTIGLTPQQLASHEKDLIKSLRQFTGPCTLLSVEKMVENSAFDNQARTDIYWFAVNPSTKKICKKHEFRKLFEPASVQMIAGKVQPWFRLERIAEETGEDTENNNSIWSLQFTAGSQLLLVLGAIIALIAIVAIICAIYCFSRYKVKSRQIHAYHPAGYQNKMNTVYLPQPPIDPRLESYETQIMEMPISDEDLTMKSGSIGQPHQRAYRNYGRPPSVGGYEGDFSIEESMYAVNVPGRIDPVTKRISTLVIPAPDYPPTQPRGGGASSHKSLL